MFNDHILNPQQFARLSAFLGHVPDQTADALAEHWGLAPADATKLVADACQERADIDAREQRALDELAVKSESDIDADHLSEPAARPRHTPELEQTIRAAFRAALAFCGTSGVSLDGLCAFAHGAFGLDAVLAFQIAVTVVAEHELLDEEAA
jgi:hypothetical protein